MVLLDGKSTNVVLSFQIGDLLRRLISSDRPDPTSGATLQLPLLTDLLSVRLPDVNEEPQITPFPVKVKANPSPASPSPLILAALPPISILQAFSSFLGSLEHVWECMVLGEPLLVIAPDPQTCSTIVWWLRDIIRPIPTDSMDLRPYLHIHDLDFMLLVNASKPQPGIVAGVTVSRLTRSFVSF